MRRDRGGRRSIRRKKVTREDMARFQAKAFERYERNRLRRSFKRGAILLAVALVVWLVVS